MMLFITLKTVTVYFIFLSLLLGETMAGGCEANWKLNGNHCYFFSTDIAMWDEAKDYCQSRNSNLVKIETAEENVFLQGHLQATSDYWIGLNDKANEGTWVWASDNSLLSKSNYVNWKLSEPNDLDDEDCGSFYKMSTGEWNDLSCSNPARYICEGFQKDIVYRVRVKAQHHPLSEYVELGGSLETGVKLPLTGTVPETDGPRESEITALNVGDVKDIQYKAESTDIDHTWNPKFVSLYKADNEGFYIERFDKSATNFGQMQKPCVRHFGKALKLQPDWARFQNQLDPLRGVKDATECKLKCIEEETIDCRIAYYSAQYKGCYIIEQANSMYYRQTTVSTSALFNRTDSC